MSARNVFIPHCKRHVCMVMQTVVFNTGQFSGSHLGMLFSVIEIRFGSYHQLYTYTHNFKSQLGVIPK